MYIWNNPNVYRDPNNIFQYFNSGRYCDGYGSFFGTDRAIRELLFSYYPNENREIISAIILSLILYPEVLAEGEDRNFFLEVRKKLRELINTGNSISILDTLKNTNGFNEVFEKITENFFEKDVFERYFNRIDNCLDENDHEKRKIFNGILLSLDIDENTNLLKKIKNPHLTGDASKIAEVIDFDRFLSKKELERKPENEQVRIMNKILKGKFLPRDFNITEHNSIIEYMANYYNKDIPFVFNIIQKTDTYNNDLVVKELVDRNFNIKKPKNTIKPTPDEIDNPEEEAREKLDEAIETLDVELKPLFVDSSSKGPTKE